MITLPDEFYVEQEQSRSYDALLNITMDMILGEDDENTTGSFAATFVSNGTVIRGTVVASRAWQKLQVKLLTDAESQGSAALGKAFEHMFKDLNEIRDTAPEKHPERPKARYWVHMKEANIHSGTGLVNTPLLRVSIDSITAWTLGS